VNGAKGDDMDASESHICNDLVNLEVKVEKLTAENRKLSQE
jgi:hypothetical protein